MPNRGSHVKCRGCGAAAHRGLLRPYCGTCWQTKIKPQLKEERAEMKRNRTRKRPRPGVLGNVGQQPGGIYAAIPPKVWEQTFIAEADDPVAAAVYLEAGGAMGLRELVEDNLAGNPLPVPVELPKPLERGPIPTPTHNGARRRLQLTPQVQQEIIQTYQAGEQISEIERAFDINRASLYVILRRHGVALRGQAPTPPEEETPMPINKPRMPVPAAPPAPVANGIPSPAVPSRSNEYVVEYTVNRTVTLKVTAGNVGQAYVEATKRLTDDPNESGFEITDVRKV